MTPTNLTRILRFRVDHDHGLYFAELPTDALRDVALGIAAAVDAAHVFEFTGDWLTGEDERRVVEPLLAGRHVVMLRAGDGSRALWYCDAWARYADDPRHTSTTFGRFTPLRAGEAADPPGTLIVVAETLEIRVDVRRAEPWYLHEPDLSRVRTLCPADPLPVETIGLAAVTSDLTIGDLCMLHERDPQGVEARPPTEVLGRGTGPVRWSELPFVIRQRFRPRDLEQFHAAGRLDDAQLAVLLEARDLLDRRALERAPGMQVTVAPSVYDVVWDFEFLEDQHVVFRGQSDAGWRLEPSIFRPERDGSPVSLGELHHRYSATAAFVERLRRRRDELFDGDVGDEELLAVAQHFGFPTPLLDYSRSLRVAAFFATQRARTLTRDDVVGVIHRVNLDADAPVARSPGRALGLDLFALAGIRAGALSAIEPRLSSADNRIARQRGVFLSAYHPRDLINIADGPFLFRQLPGEVFEDPRRGIDQATLLPADTELARMADDVWREVERDDRGGRLLAATRIPGESIVGSVGSRIRWRHFHDERTLEEVRGLLDTAGDPDGVEAVRRIVKRYFGAVRAEADTGCGPDAGEGGTLLLPFAAATAALERWAALDDGTLWRLVVDRIPRQLGDRGSTELREPPEFPSTRATVAHAIALYLLGWEHLRHAEGAVCETLDGEIGLLLFRARSTSEAHEHP